MRLPPTPPRDPRLTRLGDLFLHQVGGEIQGGFYDDFYAWWSRKVATFEQFPYAGLDFCRDSKLALPVGGAWGEMGEF